MSTSRRPYPHRALLQ